MNQVSFFLYGLLLLFLFSSHQVVSQERYCTSSDGVKVCYNGYGQGDNLVVFVHGWSCDKSYWNKQVDFFKSDYHAVTIDLDGHGSSGLGRTDWNMPLFGDDVLAVLNQFDFDKAYLVGHSMGADVILEAGSKWRKNNIHLFLIDRFENTPTTWTGETFDNFLESFKEDFRSQTYQWVRNVMFIPDSDSTLVEWIANDMSQANKDVAISAFKNLFSTDYLPIIDELNERNVQMTIVNSSYKALLNEENLEKLGFDVVVIPKCGHFIMMEQPDEFNKMLKGLIEN